MAQELTWWRGLCFVVGDGSTEEIVGGQPMGLAMTTYHGPPQESPEKAWADAQRLGKEHDSQHIAIAPAYPEQLDASSTPVTPRTPFGH